MEYRLEEIVVESVVIHTSQGITTLLQSGINFKIIKCRHEEACNSQPLHPACTVNCIMKKHDNTKDSLKLHDKIQCQRME